MYLIDDDHGHTVCLREALAIGTAAMALTLAKTLLSAPFIPQDIDLPDLDDAIASLEIAKETRITASVEYEERTRERADIPHANSLRTPT